MEPALKAKITELKEKLTDCEKRLDELGTIKKALKNQLKQLESYGAQQDKLSAKAAALEPSSNTLLDISKGLR